MSGGAPSAARRAARRSGWLTPAEMCGPVRGGGAVHVTRGDGVIALGFTLEPLATLAEHGDVQMDKAQALRLAAMLIVQAERLP